MGGCPCGKRCGGHSQPRSSRLRCAPSLFRCSHDKHASAAGYCCPTKMYMYVGTRVSIFGLRGGLCAEIGTHTAAHEKVDFAPCRHPSNTEPFKMLGANDCALWQGRYHYERVRIGDVGFHSRAVAWSQCRVAMWHGRHIRCRSRNSRCGAPLAGLPSPCTACHATIP